MIISTFVLLLALVNSADSALQAYNAACVSGTDTCAVGQICKDDGTTNFKCLCDTANKWVVNSGTNGCECSTGYTGASCKAKIGTACTVNAECVDANAYCSSGKLCACKSQYTASADKTTCAALALDGVCTATGGECASLTNAYCNTAAASAVCACATVFPKSGAACAAKSCSSGATACTGDDSNSECDTANGNVCKCKANYGIFTRGTKALCQPGVGATCTASGGQCGNLPGGYCNTAVTAPVCACGAIYDVSTASCNPKTCDRGSTTCENLDTNSECGSGVCTCKSGMSIGSAGKCVADSGAAGLIVSMVTLMGCLLISSLE